MSTSGVCVSVIFTNFLCMLHMPVARPRASLRYVMYLLTVTSDRIQFPIIKGHNRPFCIVETSSGMCIATTYKLNFDVKRNKDSTPVK